MTRVRTSDGPRLAQLENGRPHKRLTVDGRPFLILGGELHNSSSSTPAAIRQAFRDVADLGVNTVLAPVSWAQFEPTEGCFDVSLTDVLLDEARRSDQRLVLLWFGAWKNGRSTYVPPWVRSDVRRFPRAAMQTDPSPEHLSPFGPAVREADAAAFVEFMRHLRRHDEDQGTVLMVQVENEVGLLGDSRDRSALANAEFHAQVPEDVFTALDAHPGLVVARGWERQGRRRSGTWPEVFGDSLETDEAFMAAAYARHVEFVAAAGKQAYPLPMFANAWLYTQVELDPGTPAGGQAPGLYPSGGPVPRVAGLWRTLAPSVDAVVPDVYFGDFDQVCRDYTAANDALFIPEMRRDGQGVGDAFLAIGSHGAFGVSPFAIDTCVGGEAKMLSDAYRLLGAVADLLPDYPTVGVHLGAALPTAVLRLGDWVLRVSLERPPGCEAVERGYGIFIAESATTIVLTGRGLEVTITASDGRRAEMVQVDELDASRSDEPLRALNGDETESGTALVLHSLETLQADDEYRIPKARRGTGLLRVRLAAAPGAADRAGDSATTEE